MYTVHFTGKIHHGYDWMIGKLVRSSSFGITMEDNRGERYVFPSHVVERMQQRAGW